MSSQIKFDLSPVDGFDEFDADDARSGAAQIDDDPNSAHQQIAERRARLENPDILRAARAL